MSCSDFQHLIFRGKLFFPFSLLFREGAGDCSSCVGVMLELARGVAQWAHTFKSGVLFLFNTGEEEGLDGAHSFITQVSLLKLHTYAISSA